MSRVSLKWITPDAERIVVECARVTSDPAVAATNDGKGLLRYLIKHRHWSPFEMANMCIEVYTTRDIAHQMVRHHTIAFQEFSQRYASPDMIQSEPVMREARMQDHKNRQNSIDTDDGALHAEWKVEQEAVWREARRVYQKALTLGIAKEQARAVLPEGLTQTRLFANASLRTWLHYCQTRSREEGTQREHAEIAEHVKALLYEHVPVIAAAWF